jgi:hypothetical protein
MEHLRDRNFRCEMPHQEPWAMLCCLLNRFNRADFGQGSDLFETFYVRIQCIPATAGTCIFAATIQWVAVLSEMMLRSTAPQAHR